MLAILGGFLLEVNHHGQSQTQALLVEICPDRESDVKSLLIFEPALARVAHQLLVELLLHVSFVKLIFRF